jgi:hypothetical protein
VKPVVSCVAPIQDIIAQDIIVQDIIGDEMK